MIIKKDGGKILAYNSYNYKDLLRTLGFRFSSSNKAWWISSKDSRLYEFNEEFKDKGIQMCGPSKAAIQEVVLKKKSRRRKLESLDSYKKSLLSNPNLDISEFKIPEPYKAYNHQKIGLHFFYKSKIGNLYGDCGVGKTFIMLILLERLFREEVINKALIVCPKSIMEGAWLEDCKKFTPELKMCILDKKSSGNRIILTKDFSSHPKYRKEYDKPFQVYVINYEGLNALMDVIPYYGFDVLIGDESSKLKSHKSKISKNFMKLSSNFPRRYLMSGTPAPNSEKEYFSQMAVLDEEIFGKNFYGFTQNWFESVGFMGFELILNPLKQDEFVKRIYTYGLRFKQKDCVDLPDTQDITLPSYMSSSLSKVYKEIERNKVLEMTSRAVPISNPLRELLSLRQATSGFLKEEDEIRDFEKHKLETLKEFLESNPSEQVVIWACFVKDIEAIKELLKEDAGCLYGKTSSSDLSRITTEFKQGNLKYLVCNAQSVGHGHTWTNARIEVFYSMGYSSELYEQARKRIHRVGQTRKVLYYHILSKTSDGRETIDRVIYEAVNKKLKDSSEIMDRIKELSSD